MSLPMLRALPAIVVTTLLVLATVHAQAPREISDALGRIYRLREYTAFDWISGMYAKGTLTLQGFARTPQLKKDAEAAARKTQGVEEVINNIEVLPVHIGDDDIRARAYGAIYASSALERYSPGGQLNPNALRELQDAAVFGLDAVDVGRGPHAIHIIVSGARILLLGQVRAAGDRQIAEATLRSIQGVLGVTNQLRVAGQK